MSSIVRFGWCFVGGVLFGSSLVLCVETVARWCGIDVPRDTPPGYSALLLLAAHYAFRMAREESR